MRRHYRSDLRLSTLKGRQEKGKLEGGEKRGRRGEGSGERSWEERRDRGRKQKKCRYPPLFESSHEATLVLQKVCVSTHFHNPKEIERGFFAFTEKDEKQK